MVPVLSPMLPGDGRPAGRLDDWAVEPKLDGRRATLTVSGGTVRVVARTGRHLTGAVPELRALARPGLEVMLDGGLVDGRRFVAFDILWLDGVHLLHRPYSTRRAVLETLDIEGIALAPSHPGTELDAVLERCRSRGIDAVVLKRLRSVYRPGQRSGDWRTVTCAARTRHAGRRRLVDA